MWYPLSKTLAEKAAWEFAEEKGLDVVVVNPGTVMGPVIPPSINASMLMLQRLLEGIFYFVLFTYLKLVYVTKPLFECMYIPQGVQRHTRTSSWVRCISRMWH